MENKMYTMYETQRANEMDHTIKIDFFDKVDENGDYEIVRVTGDTLGASMYLGEKVGARYHRNELNKRMKAFIEEEDLKNAPSNSL